MRNAWFVSALLLAVMISLASNTQAQTDQEASGKTSRAKIPSAEVLSAEVLSAKELAEKLKIKPDVFKKIEEAMPEKAPATPKKPRKVLIYSKTNGFRHGSIPTGAVSLVMLGEVTGAYTAVHSEDPEMFSPESLARFDGVIMLNTTGECLRASRKLPEDPARKEQAREREELLKRSLVEFVKSGRGLMGTHSATDTYKRWKDYNDMMGGAFAGHPWHTEVPVRLLAPEHPLNRVFKGQGFTVRDEIYQFRDDTARPGDRKMLLSLAPDWDQIQKGKRKDGFYPISWIANYGDGRTFYCSLGHRNEIYSNPLVLEHYLAGFQYALGDLEADASPGTVD